MLAQRVEHGLRPPDEHAGVPEVLPRVQVALGGGEVGLLPEGGRLGRAFDLGGRALLHVAETGGRRGRRDAQGDQRPGPDGEAVVGGAQRVGEPLDGPDDVVGGHHGELGVRVGVGDQRGGQADRVGGVAGDRLQDQPVGAELGQRRADGVAVAGRGAHPDLLGGEDRLQPGERLGEQAVRAPALLGHDVQELLGPGGPGQRPQPRAGPAGHDHCVPHEAPSCCSSAAPRWKRAPAATWPLT